jgi:hypothetical protein
MMKKVLLVPMVLLFVAEALVASTAVPGRSVVLDLEKSHGKLRQCSRRTPGYIKLWVPGAKDIKKLERKVAAYLRDHSNSADKLDEYYRQYVGYVRIGKKYIYINGFKDKAFGGDNWKRQLADCCDCGRSLFGLSYDVESGSFDEVQFSSAKHSRR